MQFLYHATAELTPSPIVTVIALRLDGLERVSSFTAGSWVSEVTATMERDVQNVRRAQVERTRPAARVGMLIITL